MSYNSLISLKKNSFKILPNLALLDISNNYLDLFENFDLNTGMKLNLLGENSFCGLNRLKILSFSFNKVKYLELLRHSLSYLKSLEAIDLSHNLIESVSEMSFNFSKNLSSINLNQILQNFFKIVYSKT